MKIEGLDLDSTPVTANDKSLKYAKNITLSDNKKGYKNIHKLKTILEDSTIGTWEECGWIEVSTGVVIFYVVPGSSVNHIRYYKFNYSGNEETISCVRDVTGNFNFNTNRIISGTFYYNYKKELIISFTEGNSKEANETRVLNVDNPYYADEAPTDIIINVSNVNILNLIPDFIYDNLNVFIRTGGNLKSGAYQVSIRYKIIDGSYTDWSILTPTKIITGTFKQNIKPGVLTNKSLSIVFNSRNSVYFKQYQLGIVYNDGESTLSYRTDDLEYKPGNNVQYISDISALKDSTIEDLFIKSIKYIKDNAQTNFNNRLYRANVSTIDYQNIDDTLQAIANRISFFSKGNEFTPVAESTSISNYNDGTPYVEFQSGEYYSLYVGFLDKKGYLVNIYNCYNTVSNKSYYSIPYVRRSHIVYDVDEYGARRDSNNPITGTYDEIGLFSLRAKIDPADRTILIENNITSFVILFVKHDSQNSKVLSVCPCVRDMLTNNMAIEQQYWGPFNGVNNVRVYPFEYMFSNTPAIDCKVHPLTLGFDIKTGSALIYGERLATVIRDSENTYFDNVDGNPDNIKSAQWRGDNDPSGRVKTTSLLYVNIQKPPFRDPRSIESNTTLRYVPSNNSSSSNQAGESYYRAVNYDGEPSYNSDNIAPIHGKYLYFNDVKKDAILNNDWNDTNPRFGFVELLNKQTQYYVNIDNANLQIASPIIALDSLSWDNKFKYLITNPLQGDAYSCVVTLRLTAPISTFQYGNAEKPEADSNRKIFRWILTYTTISKYNLNSRFDANAVDVAYKEVLSGTDKTSDSSRYAIYNLSYEIDNLINGSIGKSYDTVYNHRGNETFVYGPFYTKNTGNYQSRVIRSDVNNEESTSLGWRTFSTNEYKDSNYKFGEIVSLKSNDTFIYVQHRNALLFTSIRDTIGNSEDGSSYVSSSDVFAREFQEILHSNIGIIGCEHEKDTYICKQGYIVIDSNSRRVYLVNANNAICISDIYAKKWFENNIRVIDNRNIRNKIRYIAADDILNNLYIINRNGANGFALSFNTSVQRFISFFDRYNVTESLLTLPYKKGIYRYVVSASRANSKDFRIDDLNSYEDCYIKVISNTNPLYNKVVEGITWKDTVSKYINGVRTIYWDETISKLAIHTDDQCTGYLPVIGDAYKDTVWYDGSKGVNKINLWMYNELNDIAKSNLFLADELTFDDTQLDNNKAWFDKNLLYNQFTYVIFGYENEEHDKEWELEEVDVNYNLDNRNQQNNSQMSNRNI